MSGHLAAAAGRIGGRANGLQEHLRGRDTQPQAERAVAIVGEKPVVAGTQGQGRANLQRLMAGTGELEEDFLLALEQDFAVVHAAGGVDEPVDLDHLPRAEAVRAGSRLGFASVGNCRFHSLHSSKNLVFSITGKLKLQS